jgi:hypothetical protein
MCATGSVAFPSPAAITLSRRTGPVVRNKANHGPAALDRGLILGWRRVAGYDGSGRESYLEPTRLFPDIGTIGDGP